MSDATASLEPRVRKGPGYGTKDCKVIHSQRPVYTLAIKPVSNRLCLNQVWPNRIIMWFTESGFRSPLGSTRSGVVHAILHTITVLIKVH